MRQFLCVSVVFLITLMNSHLEKGDVISIVVPHLGFYQNISAVRNSHTLWELTFYGRKKTNSWSLNSIGGTFVFYKNIRMKFLTPTLKFWRFECSNSFWAIDFYKEIVDPKMLEI
jgi:hypothetical protein